MKTTAISIGEIGSCIYFVRGSEVILDSDLARLYEVTPKRLNEQVKRNPSRFPQDFMFQLIQTEYESLRSQFATLNTGRGKHRKYLPFVFTEQGASMLSAVLKSDRAVEVNIAMMRAFVQFRRSNGNSPSLTQKVERIEERLNEIEEKNNRQSQTVLEAIYELKASLILTPSAAVPSKSLPNQRTEKESVSNGLQHPQVGKHERKKLQEIFRAVATYYGLEIQDLKAPTRLKAIVLPRHVAIYLIRRLTGISFNEIGVQFSGRDHSTVMHAYRKIEHALKQDGPIREAVQAILKQRDVT